MRERVLAVSGVCMTALVALALSGCADGDTGTRDAGGDCVEGAVCDTGNPCAEGRVDCRSGRALCIPDFATPPPATTCGAAGVCGTGGICSECVLGAVCDTGNPCSSGVVDCSTGTATCEVAAAVPAGVGCGAGLVCDDTGSCSACRTAASCRRCGLPWGAPIAHGESATAYEAAAVSCGGACVSESRTCNDGTLSGSYVSGTCSAPACASCVGTPWGTIANGTSMTAYASSAPPGACASETRTCMNGTLSGSYTATSCAAGCALPWGSSITHGVSVTAYASPVAYRPDTCAGETRRCTDGALSGSYASASCSEECNLGTGGACTWVGGPYQGCQPFMSVWCTSAGQSLFNSVRLGMTAFCDGDYEWNVWCNQPGTIQCDGGCAE